MNHKPDAKLGIHLLETITRGMYSQPLHCVREYIQNAFDSIREARRKGIIEPTEGSIEVIVDTHSETLSICDNGTGLDPEEAVVYLVDLGNSKKADTDDKARENAGFRGIGRMAGISYCKRLVFKTSGGSGRTCVVTFDACEINQLARPGRPPTDIAAAINDNCRVQEILTNGDSKFLQVSLEHVSNKDLLNVEVLSEYLEYTAPVRFDPSKWSFQHKITSVAKEAGHPESLDTVSVRICDSDGAVLREIYRPFKNKFATRDGRKQKKRNVIVEDVISLPKHSKDQGWWGWLALHRREGALADIPYQGLRIRMHNIAIGDQSIVQRLWTTRHLALWCFGEIYVEDAGFVPNSQRDDFEETDVYLRFLEQLREETRWIEKDIRSESKARSSSVEKITNKTTKTVQNVRVRLDRGLTSYNEKAQLIDDLDDQVNILTKELKDNNRTPDEKLQLRQSLQAVEETKNTVFNESHFKADDSVSHLPKQTRKVVRSILSVVKAELNDEQRFAVIEEKVYAALRSRGRGI